MLQTEPNSTQLARRPLDKLYEIVVPTEPRAACLGKAPHSSNEVICDGSLPSNLCPSATPSTSSWALTWLSCQEMDLGTGQHDRCLTALSYRGKLKCISSAEAGNS